MAAASAHLARPVESGMFVVSLPAIPWLLDYDSTLGARSGSANQSRLILWNAHRRNALYVLLFDVTQRHPSLRP